MKKYLIAAVAALMLCSCGKVDLTKKNEPAPENDEDIPFTTTTGSTLSTSFYFPEVDDEEPIATTIMPDIGLIDDDDENIETTKKKKKKKTDEPEITIKPATVTTTVTTTTTRATTTTTTTKATTTTTTTSATTTAPNSEYKKKREDAEKRVTDAKAELEKADKAVTDGEAAVTAAETALTNAETALNDAKAAFPYAPDAHGFFEFVGAADALGTLDNAMYADRTVMGGEGDATSLENMKKCIQYLRDCNYKRMAEGVPTLNVSYKMMAIAMSNVNVSALTGDHAKQFNVNECLKYGSGDPYGTWYDSEKNPEINGGNYQNIVNPSFTLMGFAINSSAQCKLTICYALIFSENSEGSPISVDEYTNKLNDFCARSDAANIKGYEEQVKTAKEELKKKKEALEKAKTEKDKADKELTAANVDLDKIKEEEPKNTQSGHREVILK